MITNQNLFNHLALKYGITLTTPELEAMLAAIAQDEEPAAKAKREAKDKMPSLLLECRDALPAISMTNARLQGIRLDLADRIEDALAPWEVQTKEQESSNLV